MEIREIRTLPIYRFGWRYNLFLGCDRELIMLSGLISFALTFVALSVAAFVTGMLLWLFSLWALRLMAKSDPLMRKVYLNHIRYKKFYCARSTPFVNSKRIYK